MVKSYTALIDRVAVATNKVIRSIFGILKVDTFETVESMVPLLKIIRECFLNSDLRITNYVLQCLACLTLKPNTTKPLITSILS